MTDNKSSLAAVSIDPSILLQPRIPSCCCSLDPARGPTFDYSPPPSPFPTPPTTREVRRSKEIIMSLTPSLSSLRLKNWGRPNSTEWQFFSFLPTFRGTKIPRGWASCWLGGGKRETPSNNGRLRCRRERGASGPLRSSLFSCHAWSCHGERGEGGGQR